MKKKNGAAICVAALSLLLLSGCGSSASQSPEKSAGNNAGSDYKIYLITMDMTDSYWKSIDEGCEKAAGELGNVTYKWIGPEEHDDALQSECVDEAVADGANAILISANSADGVDESLSKAIDAGCKIVYVDSVAGCDCVAALATDNEEAGKTAAASMQQALSAKGITGGTIGIMGITMDTGSCTEREVGFREGFEETGFTVADTIYMNDDSDIIRVAAEKAVDDGYVGIFGTNASTSYTTAKTIQDDKSDIIVVGFDTSDEILSMIQNGTIYSTMQQNPSQMGYEGLMTAVQAIDGTYTDTNVMIDTGVTVITKDNVLDLIK